MFYTYVVIRIPHDTGIPEIDHDVTDAVLDGIVYDSEKKEWLWSYEIESEEVADMDAKLVVNLERLIKRSLE